jgi:5-methylcytosine-specific restriction endonuclease McrA
MILDRTDAKTYIGHYLATKSAAFLRERRAQKASHQSTSQQRTSEYEAHIKSKKWRAFCAEIRKSRGDACEKCRGTKELHVHHLTYERLGDELPSDVQLLCRACHEKVHGRSFTKMPRRKKRRDDGWAKTFWAVK